MKSLKSKILGGILGLGMALSPLAAQTSTETEKEEERPGWETIIGTCGMLPNDTDLRDIFSSYFGIYAEAQRKLKDDLYLGVNGTYGFGKASNDNGYIIKARQLELMPLLVYKIDRFEIGAGPVLTNLKLIEEDNGSRDDYSISGLGLGGKAKYTLYQGKKMYLAAFGAYSNVKPSDKDFDVELGSTKFGLLFLFK